MDHRSAERIRLPMVDQAGAHRILQNVANVPVGILRAPVQMIVEILLPSDSGAIPEQPIPRALFEALHGRKAVRMIILAGDDDMKMIGHEHIRHESTAIPPHGLVKDCRHDPDDPRLGEDRHPPRHADRECDAPTSTIIAGRKAMMSFANPRHGPHRGGRGDRNIHMCPMARWARDGRVRQQGRRGTKAMGRALPRPKGKVRSHHGAR